MAASRQPVSFGPFEFDARLGLLYRGEEEIYIPPRAAGVLQCLLEQPGEVIPKQALLDAVWTDSYVSDTSLSEAVGVLRQALGDDSQNPTYIRTHHRRGYQFIGEVSRSPGLAGDVAADRAPAVNALLDSPQPSGAAPTAAPPAGPLPIVSVGSSLGQYEILAELGAGAMGIVYRAKDTVLDREVAIKVLPEDFLSDPGRVERLEREAKLLASVSHPNIASIHSLEESDGIKFPVLELVEGETLDQRLRAGPMDVTNALEIARQMAAALEAAHERGIIHRDLKPANIKLTPDGQVKVLDFGLAKALEVHVLGADASQSPTESMTIVGSRRGSIVGTAAYMSPEQARGEEVDKRADLWSFGCVVYELLTGRRAFEGDTVSETIAGVLEREPDWEALPPETPRAARRVVRRCLKKDSRDRLHAIADARIEIDDALIEPGESSAGVDAGVQVPVPLWRQALPWSLVALMALLLGLVVWAPWQAPPTPVFPDRLNRVLPPSQSLPYLGTNSAIAISPDGSRLAYRACREGYMDQCELYVLEFSTGEAESIGRGYGPFFSPDGGWLGFVRDSRLMKTDLDVRSPPVPLAGESRINTRGASWRLDDRIVFAPGNHSALEVVPAGGGQPDALTSLDAQAGERGHRFPHVLPNGRGVVFVVWGVYVSQIVAESLITGDRKFITTGTSPSYVSPGYLLFVRREQRAPTAFTGTLYAVPFDIDALQTTGPEVPVEEDVFLWGGGEAAAYYAVSETGRLAYAPGPSPDRRLALTDFDGIEMEELAVEPDCYAAARFSPDGRRLALEVSSQPARVDLYELDQGVQSGLLSSFTDEAGVVWSYESGVEWSPDGSRIAVSAGSTEAPQVFIISVDGTFEPDRLVATDASRPQYPEAWAPDGRTLLYRELGAETRYDIWEVALDGDRVPRQVAGGPRQQFHAAISPDGRWLAFTTSEVGGYEIWVQPYGRPGRGIQVSSDGGMAPIWSVDGRELYFRDGTRMMAVDIETEPELSAGRPRRLFDGQYLSSTSFFSNPGSLSAEGDRFVMIKAGEPWGTRIDVVDNWFERLKRLIPTGR